MRISIISTSPRQNSNSLKVAKAIEKQLHTKGEHQTQVFNFEKYDLPYVGQGEVTRNNLSEYQSQLIKCWNDGQIVFFVVPEYNWNTSPQFINTIHQLGNQDFAHLFNDKLFAIVGVSNGRGGRQPILLSAQILNKMINFMNQYSIVSPRGFESQETPVQLDIEGNFIGNELYENGFTAFIDYNLTLAQRWFK